MSSQLSDAIPSLHNHFHLGTYCAHKCRPRFSPFKEAMCDVDRTDKHSQYRGNVVPSALRLDTRKGSISEGLAKMLTLSAWREAQTDKNALARLRHLVATAKETNPTTKALIFIASPAQIEEQWDLISKADSESMPLFGVPCVIKDDNIDVAGVRTTAACPVFNPDPAKTDSPVVARLKAAGAIVIGKANMDQFATGLVGTRTPHGPVPNSFKPNYVSGGSSAGSAVSVSKGLVPFALGTDTAGSGRVPAGLNNVVGLKPTRGCLSARGVVPACRTLDCVSIFAHTVEDAEFILSTVEGYDVEYAYSRPRPNPNTDSTLRGFSYPCLGEDAPKLAICADPPWFGRDDHRPAYEEALKKARNLGWNLVPVDFTALLKISKFLYEGPWVAERYATLRDFIETVAEEDMDGVTRSIIVKANNFDASDLFTWEYRRQDLAREIQLTFEEFDAIFVPTAPTIPTMEQVAERPIVENNLMGTYTNYVNLLDWCAISIPARFRPDGLPFGVTLVAGTWQEKKLITLARQWFSGETRLLGATEAEIHHAKIEKRPPAV